MKIGFIIELIKYIQSFIYLDKYKLLTQIKDFYTFGKEKCNMRLCITKPRILAIQQF